MEEIELSPLAHTWLFDIDGTIARHNGYRDDGRDTILDGVKEFFERIPESDKIIFLTSRSEEFRKSTEEFLAQNGIRFDGIFFGLPFGERILVNDEKPGGLKTSRAVNLVRNEFALSVKINSDL